LLIQSSTRAKQESEILKEEFRRDTVVPVETHGCEELTSHSPLKPTPKDREKLRVTDTVWLLQFVAYGLLGTLHSHEKV